MEPGESSAQQGLRATLRGPGFIFSARRLWLLATWLYHNGHTSLARLVRNVNTMLYHNYLGMQARVSPDIQLGHHATGTVIHGSTVIGHHVKIFQNVTIFVRPPTGTNKVIIGDGVVIGANAVLLTPLGKDLRIGDGARVGAGAVVSHDVPDRMVAVSPRAELRPRKTGRGPVDFAEMADEEDED